MWNSNELETSAAESNGDDEVGRVGSSGGGARYKLMSPAKLPISRSPCLTIPPGLSPSSFLESPVLLSNIKAEPSPTTGSFFKPQLMHGYGGSTIFSSIINSCSSMVGSSSSRFEFQPASGSMSTAGFSLARPSAPADSSNQQSGQSMQVQAQTLSRPFASSSIVRNEVAASSSQLSLSAPILEVSPIDTVPAPTDSDESNQKSLEVVQYTDHSGVASSMNERTSDDGYNWRKYGQKLVKGSEYPRSYYKCTHPNCEVKKLFERAPDGKIAEIIYKGTHDHPKPQPNRRLSAGSMVSIQEDRSDKFSSLASQEDKPSTISGQTPQNKDPTVIGELPAPKANENIVEVGLSPLNRPTDDADDDDDPFAKRRKMEIGGVDINSVIKPIREPRVVVQTLSEVDILDDGYRWRKYGQKVVRGNPNPRSYYKCTSAGCPVRKHVERASHDPKAVITTYEGKHNHDVPTAKNNNHDTTSSLAPRARQQDAETVSLDLGVGISSGTDNAPGHQAMDTEPKPTLRQAQINASNLLLLHATPVSYPAYVNDAMIMYATKDNHGEGLNVVRNPPLSHSTHPYPQNIGRLLMGP
uniref:WRKY transcription factor n=1 Tax=Fagopyrum tataricum TaxID=62330 RepID=A0A4P9Q276_FAGTA|nr:WRKY transcription factor [Fagopyrum tataricum]